MAPDWRRELLENADGLSIEWGPRQYIERNQGAVSAGFPHVPFDARQVLEALCAIPFEFAVMPPIRHWQDEYFAPAIGADHALLGWGMIVRGAGHEDSVVSRRWLEHSPCRVLKGANDTTFVQFHDVATPGPEDPYTIDRATFAQARPAHEWIVAGFLRPKHRYAHDIQGLYTREDGLLRVIVNDREVSDRELVDACAARRDRRHDAERPIRNIAYVFVDPGAAEARLEALWLRGLECRTLRDGKETRLDEQFSLPRRVPSWVTDLERAA
jgi:hypothetical protein